MTWKAVLFLAAACALPFMVVEAWTLAKDLERESGARRVPIGRVVVDLCLACGLFALVAFGAWSGRLR